MAIKRSGLGLRAVKTVTRDGVNEISMGGR
jgi:hypothetical protein